MRGHYCQEMMLKRFKCLLLRFSYLLYGSRASTSKVWLHVQKLISVFLAFTSSIFWWGLPTSKRKLAGPRSRGLLRLCAGSPPLRSWAALGIKAQRGSRQPSETATVAGGPAAFLPAPQKPALEPWKRWGPFSPQHPAAS